MATESVAIETQSKKEREEVIKSHEMSSEQIETATIEGKEVVIQDLQKALEIETKNLAEVEKLETIQPIVELQEDIVEKIDIRVEMKNEIDIQEIQSSEYVGELNVIKEETVEGAEIKEIEKVKVEDVQISREVTKIQESVLKEAVNEMSTMKLESTSVAEAKELVQDVKIEESISEASDIKIEIKDECAQLKITKEEITEVSENVEVEQEVEEEIQEIERKSSLLASAIDETIKSIQEYKEEVGIDTKTEPIVYNGYAKVIKTKVFNLDTELPVNVEQQVIKNTDTINKIVENRDSVQNTEALENSCEVIETTEAKMGENEDVSVDGYRPVPFNPDDAPHLERVKITIPGPTPTVDPGKAFVTPNGEIIGTHQGIVDDSEVLKALNEEFMRTQEEKKKEERKWTKFLQKPSRPVPKAKFGYHGYTATEEEIEVSRYV
ncbi:hypothetical protein MSG28_016197 [Choristoneura fumiferana]|uniref:Uncharacterized protein n=1 Tax=Choristoneura fumiferana TaxID=7141 RepID=A0ACC0K6A4_CHOFU|nr:hypothetical protein MSG28_016197 [Choristoneura fumiferana]